ncbi:MAG TPA: FAD-dependent oxidoreductase [Thermoanaerobaculia bacterium]|nr:FAD-dependent oxidoreductase [Thermoanaerobaculia bacterium]
MSGGLTRDPRRAASSSYDLVVVGGGIHGVAATLEAARRGLSVLLLERDDFGGATTWNSLRIVHGGLRYLQSLDLRRFRESVGERRWLLEHFPDLVEPLPCLMPLYSPPRGGRLRRRTPFRVALALNDRLAPDPALAPGRLLDARETAELCPAVDPEGLSGGALWHDAVAPNSQRLLIEMLRWACGRGAVALSYVEAAELRVEEGRVAGVRALDRASGERLDVTARAVLNCAGPWARRVAHRFHRDLPALAQPVLAFNLFLDIRADAILRGRTALAVAAPGSGAQTWFLLPWKERILAGTAYVTGAGEAGESGPGDAAVEGFLRELNAALPALGANRGQVLRVHWGWLPAAAEGSAVPGSRPVIHDHGREGGPAGLVSLSGVKLTTARALAERALSTLFPGLPRLSPLAPAGRPAADPPLPWEGFARLAEDDWGAARSWLAGFAERQAVVELDDLLLRRTDWGVIPERAALAERLCRSLLLGRPRGGRAAAPSEDTETLMAAGRGRG